MKRAIVVLLTLLMAVPSFADAREEKQGLILELLEVIDAKQLTQASFDALFAAIRSMNSREPAAEEIPEDYRAEWEAMKKKEQEELDKFRERLFSRVDYQKYSDAAYVPLFDERFSNDELKELIAFFKTKSGQKLIAILPALGVGGVSRGKSLLMQAAEDTSAELEKEEIAKKPWRPTMADIRSIATALEARATDENSYPDVSFEGLEALISPIYIKQVPKVDAWGTPYVYVGDGDKHYRIVSAGADRRFEWSARQMAPEGTAARATDDPDADIIFQDGLFLQFPAEAQPQH